MFTADDVGDGLEMWERLFRALGPKYEKIVDKFKAGLRNHKVLRFNSERV